MAINDELATCLRNAIAFRREFTQSAHDSAFRLVNGFTEGLPELAVDIFARTAVIHDYSGNGEYSGGAGLDFVLGVLRAQLPWLKAAIVKPRTAATVSERCGRLVFGGKPDDRVTENNIRYAIDLTINRDDSFYPDTRLLRRWIFEHAKGIDVLNTFAYTGSLGIAAAVGGAADLLQTDLSDKFLSLAVRSGTMNGIVLRKKNFLSGDFFTVVSKLKKAQRRFDCVILDPPFFSRTAKGVIDLAAAPEVPVNKVRPLVRPGGRIVVVNNSLYLSGRNFMTRLDALTLDGYLAVESVIPVPPDFTGPDLNYRNCYAVDPSPFNHPTKIVILRVLKVRAGGIL